MKNFFIAISIFAISIILAVGVISYYKIDTKKCIGCAICVPNCPTHAIAIHKRKAVIDTSLCIACGKCLAVCPVKAPFPVLNEIDTSKSASEDSSENEPLDTNKIDKGSVARGAQQAREIYGEKVNGKPAPSENVDSFKVAKEGERSNRETPERNSEKIFPVLDPVKCISCGVCATICPKKAIKMKNRKPIIDIKKCDGCGICVSGCPVRAFEFPEKK